MRSRSVQVVSEAFNRVFQGCCWKLHWAFESSEGFGDVPWSFSEAEAYRGTRVLGIPGRPRGVRGVFRSVPRGFKGFLER